MVWANKNNSELTASKTSCNILAQLLDVSNEKIKWVPLNRLAEISKVRISNNQLNQSNYVGVDNLLPDRNGKVDSKFVPIKGSSIMYEKNDILIGNIRPYLKKIWLSDGEGGTNADVIVIHITNSSINPRYLYQVLATDDFFSYNMRHAKGAKMPRGNKTKIMEYLIPLPSYRDPIQSLQIQNGVVAKLDQFETLTASMAVGIPKEIELRQKQYEYYRNLLLSFPKKDIMLDW